MAALPVTVCDVGPRHGLQNEPETLEPAARAELVDRLARGPPPHRGRELRATRARPADGGGRATTGVDLPSLIGVAQWLETLLGRVLPGQLYRAGLP